MPIPRTATFGTAELLVEDESLQVWMTPVSVFEPIVTVAFHIVAHQGLNMQEPEPGQLGMDDMKGPKVAVWALLGEEWQRCTFRGGGMGGGDRGLRCDRNFGRPGDAVSGIAQVRVDFEFRGLTASRVLDRIA